MTDEQQRRVWEFLTEDEGEEPIPLEPEFEEWLIDAAMAAHAARD